MAFVPSSLFHETPFNQVGGTYEFSMAQGHAQMVEQGLQILAEHGAQARTVLGEAGQHVAGGRYFEATWRQAVNSLPFLTSAT